LKDNGIDEGSRKALTNTCYDDGTKYSMTAMSIATGKEFNVAIPRE
jgi:hypothetical protein